MDAEEKTLPVISVEALFAGDVSTSAELDRTIGKACEKSGGFVATGLPRSLRLNAAEIATLLSVFDLPQPLLDEVGKREICPGSKRSFRGYVMRRAGGFAYNEIFDVGPEPPVSGPPLENIELLIETNAWPARDPAAGWRDLVINHYRHMEAFALGVIRAVARYLDVDETAAVARYQHSNSTFRLLRYPERPPGITIRGEKDAMRQHHGREYPLIGSEHTDNGGLTLVWQDQPGLQLRSPAGAWLDLPDTSDGLSILVGESLQTQSSNRFTATPHRVLGQGQTRHSMVFFLEPGLYSSTRAFSSSPVEALPADEDTYAASMLATLRKTGRI